MKLINYPNVTFNPNDGSYRPYGKLNDETRYIHIQLYHPPSVTKQLPRSIERRLSQLSSSKDIFYEMTAYYEQRLASCEYNEKLTYNNKEKIMKIIKILGETENAILYGLTHPTTSRWKQALANTLLDSNFPPGHKLYQIFNKNTLKLIYFFMSNLKAKIDGYDKKTLENKPPPKTKLSNCLKKEKSPMRAACLTENVLY